MDKRLVRTVRSTLERFNVGITRLDTLQAWRDGQVHESKIRLLLSIPKDDAEQLLPLLRKSRSQLGQDLFVLHELNFRKDGYFVEFGATDGVGLSNTHLLEKEFGWCGILAEPARCWHKELQKNRNSCIETRCVWTDSNSSLNFNEVDSPELSTIDIFSTRDANRDSRRAGRTYAVPTITLNDLLEKYNAPAVIDYLSIDTEGSEFAILDSFHFDRYRFRVITCEHNFTEDRQRIFELLTSNGYVRKLEDVSSVDDWYVWGE